MSLRKANKERLVAKNVWEDGGGGGVVSGFLDVLLCHESLQRPQPSKSVPETRTKMKVCPSRKGRGGGGVWEN